MVRAIGESRPEVALLIGRQALAFYPFDPALQERVYYLRLQAAMSGHSYQREP